LKVEATSPAEEVQPETIAEEVQPETIAEEVQPETVAEEVQPETVAEEVQPETVAEEISSVANLQEQLIIDKASGVDKKIDTTPLQELMRELTSAEENQSTVANNSVQELETQSDTSQLADIPQSAAELIIETSAARLQATRQPVYDLSKSFEISVGDYSATLARPNTDGIRVVTFPDGQSYKAAEISGQRNTYFLIDDKGVIIGTYSEKTQDFAQGSNQMIIEGNRRTQLSSAILGKMTVGTFTPAETVGVIFTPRTTGTLSSNNITRDSLPLRPVPGDATGRIFSVAINDEFGKQHICYCMSNPQNETDYKLLAMNGNNFEIVGEIKYTTGQPINREGQPFESTRQLSYNLSYTFNDTSATARSEAFLTEANTAFAQAPETLTPERRDQGSPPAVTLPASTIARQEATSSPQNRNPAIQIQKGEYSARGINGILLQRNPREGDTIQIPQNRSFIQLTIGKLTGDKYTVLQNGKPVGTLAYNSRTKQWSNCQIS
ncbi:ribonuclease E/G family, partial [Candidatus Termititenax aidoneus]